MDFLLKHIFVAALDLSILLRKSSLKEHVGGMHFPELLATDLLKMYISSSHSSTISNKFGRMNTIDCMVIKQA